MVNLTWDTQGDWDGERDAAGIVHDGVDDHPGAGSLAAGYVYGGFSEALIADLVGWWPLHERAGQANDLSGNGNHGSVNGATQGVGGRGGLTATSFDGSDDYISTGADISNDGNFSYSFWLYDRSTTDAFRRWITTTDGNFSSSTSVVREQSSGEIALYADSNSTQTSGHSWKGEWHHYVLVSDGTSTTLYEDSNELLSTANVTSNPESGFYIGGRNASSNSEYTDGIIADVRAYNRALSASEVQTLYEWGSGDYAVPPDNNDGGVSYYPFNSSNANDAWGSNDGTVNGATYLPSGGPRGDGAYSFDGAGDYIDTGADFDFGGGPLTVCAWAQANDDGALKRIVGKDSANTNRSYVLQVGGSMVSNFYLWDGTNTGHAVGNITISDEWYFHCGVFTGSEARYYLNGVLKDSVSVGSMQNSTTTTHIGNAEYGVINNTHWFNGDIDDVRIYNRALDPWEIQEIYQYGTLGRDLRHYTAQVIA